MSRLKPPTERFWEKVELAPRKAACWEWEGGRTSAGYGHFQINRKTVLAHRFAYELLREPIPEGMDIDHACRNHGCVNPDHLEPVTERENVLRGIAPPAVNARRKVCKNGHPLSGENLRVAPSGARICITCDRNRHSPEYWREYRAKRKAEGRSLP